MRHKFFTLTTLGAALTVLGAGCFAKTTVNVGNTSVSANISGSAVIDAVTNSSSTGDFSTNASAGTNAAASVAAKTVTITAAGVSPKTLTVSAGTTVTFVNTDTIAHQLASDPHPSHSGLPGFDNTAKSSSYSFTFTKKGTFGYHDHLDPFNNSTKGTIIVQ